MKAVIMAGGDGRRLRPLTCTKPKPLIPLLNRPILDYTMDLLAKHNINEAVFTLHYLGDMIKKHIGSGGAWGISASYSEPGRKLGTAGSVRVPARSRAARASLSQCVRFHCLYFMGARCPSRSVKSKLPFIIANFVKGDKGFGHFRGGDRQWF